MSNLFSIIWAPFGAAWAVAERNVWLAIAVLTAIGIGLHMIDRNLAAHMMVYLVALLLMRHDSNTVPASIVAEPTPLEVA